MHVRNNLKFRKTSLKYQVITIEWQLFWNWVNRAFYANFYHCLPLASVKKLKLNMAEFEDILQKTLKLTPKHAFKIRHVWRHFLIT